MNYVELFFITQYKQFMKLLFINPSLRTRKLSFVLTSRSSLCNDLCKKKGFDFDLLDVDAGNLSDKEVENYIKENQYDVICMEVSSLIING